ncbi:MAG: IS110 family transposase [Solirubrobacterales bacterium]
MIVIGADIHKRNHMLVAVGAQTGELHAELQIAADQQGHQAALRWARELDAERVWALEDCRQVSRRLEQALLAAGERVVRVAPRLTGLSRRADRRAGKSDPIDALAVARVAVREGPERLPSAFLDAETMEIRLLADHREDLVAERTRAQNRLRWHLLDLCPELEAQLPVRSLGSGVHLRRLADRLEGLDSTRARIARMLVDRICEITEEVKRLQAEIEALVRAHRPALLAETGCGPLTAATLIGHAAGAERFRGEAQFARMAGVAPIPVSSGKSERHRLHRGGDRQLNRALHVIAITRSRLDPETRSYLDKKRAEGKSNREALRCLKRHLARRFYRLLLDPSLSPSL